MTLFCKVGLASEEEGTYTRASEAEYKICNTTDRASYHKCFEDEETRTLPYKLIRDEKTPVVALLLHGLSDGPFMYKDIAYKLFKMGMNVVVPRLSGHGTDMNDLHNVKYEHWIDDVHGHAASEALRYGERIFLSGFSMGAIAASHLIIHGEKRITNKIKGLALFSPFLNYPTPAFTHHAARAISCLRKGQMSKSSDYPGGGESFRYMRMSNAGICEVGKLIQETKLNANLRPFYNIPLFGVFTEDDSAIHIPTFMNLMENTYPVLKNRFLIYTRRSLEKKKKLHRHHITMKEYEERLEIDGWRVYKKVDHYLDHAATVLEKNSFNESLVDNSPEQLGRLLNYEFRTAMEELEHFVLKNFQKYLVKDN